MWGEKGCPKACLDCHQPSKAWITTILKSFFVVCPLRRSCHAERTWLCERLGSQGFVSCWTMVYVIYIYINPLDHWRIDFKERMWLLYSILLWFGNPYPHQCSMYVQPPSISPGCCSLPVTCRMWPLSRPIASWLRGCGSCWFSIFKVAFINHFFTYKPMESWYNYSNYNPHLCHENLHEFTQGVSIAYGLPSLKLPPIDLERTEVWSYWCEGWYKHGLCLNIICLGSTIQSRNPGTAGIWEGSNLLLPQARLSAWHTHHSLPSLRGIWLISRMKRNPTSHGHLGMRWRHFGKRMWSLGTPWGTLAKCWNGPRRS